jgi:hypothetical protein
MPVTLTKTKSKTTVAPTKAQPKTGADSFEAKIATATDTFVERSREAAELKTPYEAATKKRADASAAFLELYNSKFDDDEKRVVEGHHHKVSVGARAVKRTIPQDRMVAIQKKLNSIQSGLFMKVTTIALGVLGKHLTEEEMGDYLEVEITKTRTVKPL